MITDITKHKEVKHKRAEDALKKSEANLRAIFNNSLQYFVLLDQDKKILAFNRVAKHRAKKNLGLDMKSGDSMLRFVVSEGLADFNIAFARAIKGRVTTKEFKLKDAEGEYYWVEANLNPVFDDNQKAIGVCFSLIDINDRKKAEESLLSYQAQLRSLASKICVSEEQERRRIAIELHDRVGTSLSLCKIKLEGLSKAASHENSAAAYTEILGLIEQAISDTRSLTLELSPPVLYELGLGAALEWLADQFREQHGIMVEVVHDGRLPSLDEQVRGVLFRAVRELLINVSKHARIDRAEVFTCMEGETIRITVEDRGQGFDASTGRGGFNRTGGFGLFSIKERVEHLGGCLMVEARPGQGARVTLSAPVKIVQGRDRKGRI